MGVFLRLWTRRMEAYGREPFEKSAWRRFVIKHRCDPYGSTNGPVVRVSVRRGLTEIEEESTR